MYINMIYYYIEFILNIDQIEKEGQGRGGIVIINILVCIFNNKLCIF